MDWAEVAALYAELARRTESPVVELNRAVAIAELAGPEEALRLVDALDLDGYRYLHSTRADLLRRLDRNDEAAAAYDARARADTGRGRAAVPRESTGRATQYAGVRAFGSEDTRVMDVGRIRAFRLALQERSSSRSIETAHGVARLADSIPDVYDANYLSVEGAAGAGRRSRRRGRRRPRRPLPPPGDRRGRRSRTRGRVRRARLPALDAPRARPRPAAGPGRRHLDGA